jgi:hypothetical protein
MRADLARPLPDGIVGPVAAGVDTLETATAWMVATQKSAPALAAAGAVAYLRLVGTVAGGWLMANSAAAAAAALAAGDDPDFHRAKIATARFYAAHEMPAAAASLAALTDGGAAVLDFDTDWL